MQWVVSVKTSLIVVLLLLPLTALAQEGEIPRTLDAPTDVWTEPNPGLRHLDRRYARPSIRVHALVVDTRVEGVRLVATPESERWGTVTDFAERHEAAAAINGGFWGLWQSPHGITAGGGALWERSTPDPDFGHFGVLASGRGVVRGPGEGEDDRSLAQLSEAVAGRPILVAAGQVDTAGLDAFEAANLRQPRTAVGVSRDGRTFVLAVVDGRQGHSVGFTLYQLARLLVELGAHRAINLDGGGSSAMVVSREGGLVTSPARGRWVRALGLGEEETRQVRTEDGATDVYVRGVEREVMNHIAVIAPPPTHDVAVRGVDSALADGLGPSDRGVAVLAPARSSPIRLGQLREVLIPALYLTAPALLLLGVVVLRRRRLS